MTALISAAALLLALLIDRWLGEPPARLHPVVWIGRYLGWAGRRLQRITQPLGCTDIKAFWLAAFYWCVGAAIVAGVFWALQMQIVDTFLLFDATVMVQPDESALTVALRFFLQLLAVLLMALLLKPLLAWAMLKSEVRSVESALGQSLDAGRERLSWLVSRDVSALSEAQVRESAIESLAENLNDSVVAPIFWFVLLGLPGAALYRFANTADAMWGYRGVYKDQNWEWAGKWAARADDVLSWLPARLTALLLVLASRARWRAVCREAAKTPSPNSGWPMATMALALDIRLGKPGVYVLNPTGRQPTRTDTARAVMYAETVTVVVVCVALPALVLRSMVVS
jgi:adenosylcobinamide-phosphate synthase